MMGGRIQLKKDTVPHIFDYQKDKQHTHNKPDMKPGAVKQIRIQTLQDMEKEVSEKTIMADEMTAECSTQAEMNLNGDILIQENMDIDEMSNLEIQFKVVGTQTKPYYRSKAILCKVVSKDMACIPFK